MSQNLAQRIVAAAALAFALLLGAFGLSSEPAMAKCPSCDVLTHTLAADDAPTVTPDIAPEEEDEGGKDDCKHNWKLCVEPTDDSGFIHQVTSIG